jgi:hypothetical protein
VSVSSKVSVYYPFSSLHEWKISVFSQPIDSIAGLPENEGVLLLKYSLGIFLSLKEWLTLEELKVLEDLAAKSVIDTIIYKVVSAIT